LAHSFTLPLPIALAAHVALAPAPLGASEPRRLLEPTPLVLKDGRIASVTVLSVPFPPGGEVPEAAARATLDRAVAELATDCFLTAQIIGHAEPGADGDSATLAAHRLARARANNIHAVLMAHGLPPGSLAAVWDWQLAVQEPRVTLWVFRLTVGDDCEGEPLEAALAPPSMPATAMAPPPVATPPAGPDETEPAPPVGEGAETPAELAGQPPEPTATLDAPSAQAETVDATGVEPVDPTQAEPVVAAEAAAVAPAEAAPEVPPATEAPVDAGGETPAPAPADAEPPPEQVPPELSSTTPEPPRMAVENEPATTVEASDGASALTIEFADNSSYFPKPTGERLAELAKGLSATGAYEVALEATVAAGSDYARWLAERRMQRVSEALSRRARGRTLTFKHAFREDDPRRQVVVRIRPLP
jgi:hypothetical protein